MKYKNIKTKDISLIKYNDKYKLQLKDLKNINEIFTSYIEKWPSYMNEDSKMQSYMIMDDLSNCYGGLFLYPSPANKQELVVNYLMTNQYIDEFNYRVFDNVIKSLGEYFYEYQSFSINLYNGTELEHYNTTDYKKIYSIYTHASYKFDNMKNHIKYSNLDKYINDTKLNLIDNNIQYNMCGKSYDESNNKDELIKQYNNKEINVAELFNDINILLIKYDNNRAIEFNDKGDVCLRHTIPGKYSSFLYSDVLSDEIDWVTLVEDEKYINYEKNNVYSDIKIKIKDYDIRIFNPKNQNYKVMTYKSSKKNNSSNIVTMYVDDNNNILKLYVDYNIHKNAKDENRAKIKGTYTLRIDNQYGKKDMKYISRSGWFDRYNFESLEDYKHSLYDAVTSGILTTSNADELINIVAYYFNQFNDDKINITNENMCQTMFDTDDYVFNVLESINKENMVPVLKDNINSFIDSETTKKKDKVKTYKKDN